MFIPHTPAFLTAWQKRPTLWREAMDKHVCIASEQTLYAALQIIRMTWRQITQAENHEKVYALANEMLDRVGQFMKKYSAVGTALASAQKAYEEGEKKLSEIRRALENYQKETNDSSIEITTNSFREEDWANNWKQYFKPYEIGKHIVINKQKQIRLNISKKNMDGAKNSLKNSISLEL